MFRHNTYIFRKKMDVPKIGKHPKMDGENNGNPIKMDDLGVPPF